jgi:hypothetical protein
MRQTSGVGVRGTADCKSHRPGHKLCPKHHAQFSSAAAPAKWKGKGVTFHMCSNAGRGATRGGWSGVELLSGAVSLVAVEKKGGGDELGYEMS